MSVLLDRHIEQTPGTRGGRPRITGTRITVDDIVIMHRHLLQSLEEIAGKFNLAPAAVYAAMAYYYDHRIEIDQQILDDDAFVELSKRQNPSILAGEPRDSDRG
jgi:uncharacterized protein (DUF433 family)